MSFLNRLSDSQGQAARPILYLFLIILMNEKAKIREFGFLLSVLFFEYSLVYCSGK